MVELTYDPRYNVAYLRLQRGPTEVETIHISDELNIGIAPDGTVYGIELLNANVQLGGEGQEKLIVFNEASGRRRELSLTEP